jgi:hypothetical protein
MPLFRATSGAPPPTSAIIVAGFDRPVSISSFAPLAQLLPSLDKFLKGARRREGAAVNDAAIAVGALVEVEDRTHAQVSQVVRQFVEMSAAEGVFTFGVQSELGAAGHGDSLSFSLFVRYDKTLGKIRILSDRR